MLHFKPTVFVDDLDAAVTARSADYRVPDDVASPAALAAGSGWFDSAEDTVSPSDFFNEAESAYTFDLDPTAGLTFDLDGSVAVPGSPVLQDPPMESIARPATR